MKGYTSSTKFERSELRSVLGSSDSSRLVSKGTRAAGVPSPSTLNPFMSTPPRSINELVDLGKKRGQSERETESKPKRNTLNGFFKDDSFVSLK